MNMFEQIGEFFAASLPVYAYDRSFDRYVFWKASTQEALCALTRESPFQQIVVADLSKEPYREGYFIAECNPEAAKSFGRFPAVLLR